MAVETEPDPSARRARVLLIEDNAPARQALARVLEAQGYDVAQCGTALEGLHALQVGPTPAAVLTDLQLPDLDGREVARAARQLVPTPFVALITGWPIVADPADPTPTDVDHVFLKPVRIDDLLGRLERAIRGPRGA